MNALDGAERAQGDPYAAGKIWVRIIHDQSVVRTILPVFNWKIAAIILILVSFNVFTMVYFASGPVKDQKEMSSVANELFSYIETINL